MNAATSATPPSPERIFDTLIGYERTAALKAAIELDIFTAIAEGHNSVDKLAQRSQASPRGVRILCDYLVISGLLGKSDGTYELTPDTATFLSRKSPAYLGGSVQFLMSPMMLGAFADLTPVVRKGTTALPEQGSVSDENPAWVDFARGMMPMMFGPAQYIAGLVADRGPIKVLDVAAGHGLFGIMIAQKNPAAVVTALDWAQVLEVAKENAAKFGVSDRISYSAGSAFDVDWGTEHDVVLLTNFLHHFDPPTCEQILRKARQALKPGGQCMALEFVPNEDRVTPPIAAAFSMTMLATTPAGDAYTRSEYERIFQNAGLTTPEVHTVPQSPENLLVAQRPD